ncbi:Uncharacterised protein [Vibrio cholerae]|nr:Uncharacterised protein [Vibrio cholerae]CSI14116.1 Uncharacterised protein [Vibrio cholerae]
MAFCFRHIGVTGAKDFVNFSHRFRTVSHCGDCLTAA